MRKLSDFYILLINNGLMFSPFMTKDEARLYIKKHPRFKYRYGAIGALMNRRAFLKSSSAAILLFTLPVLGCNNVTVAEFVSLIGRYASLLATYFNQGSLAAQILSLSSQIAIDITNWQSGSSPAQAIQAIQDLLNLIGTIPAVGAYVQLADLLLSALSGLLLLLPPSTGRMIPQTVHGRAVSPLHYPDASKKSMTQAKKNLESQWAALTAAAPLK